ncbi:hypothetical protein T484DRAFT_1983459 [Baffinella frigidus]|nr:hypothetical protein T484DRAFT_1983459 [Cryptophyta sp. CCMP2293]
MAFLQNQFRCPPTLGARRKDLQDSRQPSSDALNSTSPPAAVPQHPFYGTACRWHMLGEIKTLRT